ncbi:hypothetical protein FAIPA1_30315 [Frankia sp. AiPs1]
MPQVPFRSALALDFLLGEGPGAAGKMTAEDHGVRPDVPGDVRSQVARQHGEECRAGKQRKYDIIFPALTGGLPEGVAEVVQGLVQGLFPAPGSIDLHVVERDSPFEDDREGEVVQRLSQVDGAPRLLGSHPEQAVPDVPVSTENVCIGVVNIVVRIFPLGGGRREIPFPGGGVDMGVAHPVPLPVQNVVADLHVLENLGEGEHRRTCQPCRRQQGRKHHHPAAGLQSALSRDHPSDVPGVVLSSAREELRAEAVKLLAKFLDFTGAERGRYCHPSAPYRSMSTGP